jgi:hypothetical protein
MLIAHTVQCFANLMLKSTVLFHNHVRDVFDKKGSREECLREAQKFLEQIVPRIILELPIKVAPGPVSTKALARRSAHQDI